MIPFIWKYIKEQKGRFFFIALFDSLAWPSDAIVWPLLLSHAVTIFTKFDADRPAAWNTLLPIIIGALCLVAFVEFASRTMGFLMAKAVPKLQAHLRMEMFDHVQHHTPRYFNERLAGSLANKITDMTTGVEALLQYFFWPIIPAIATCFFAFFFFWFIRPIFAGVFLIWVITQLGISLLFTRNIAKTQQIHGEKRSELLGKIVDSLTNNFAVNLFFRFKYEKRLLTPTQKEEEETNHKARFFVQKMSVATSVVHFVIPLIGMFGTLIYAWLHSWITTGEAVQVFAMAWNAAAIIWILSSTFPPLFQTIGTIKQAYTVLLDPQDLGDQKKAKPLAVQKGAIVFDNVSFRYGKQDLFVNKHVKIQGEEKVGLVGYTGAGKSTFVNLILRFFPLHNGTISIDNQDIANVSLASLRSQIALIPQDPILFHRSLRENILYGNPDATEEEFLHAAKLAHCDPFIRALPDGYDSIVGERGTKLSGGEKQRIAIARAVLSNAPILMLDEATSSLDTVTEKLIQQSLEKVMEGRTTLVIAHRLSTLSQMDRILVFDRGKIVEEGTHTALMKKNGHYAKMWNMQVGGFLPETPN